jgi:hypothetical protein
MSSLITRLVLFIFVINSLLHAETIVLTSGESLNVSVIARGDGSVQVVHSILGKLNIPNEAIKTIEESITIAKTVPKTQDNVSSHTPSNKEPSWNQTIKVGAGYQTGQTNNVDLSSSYHADQTVNEHQTILDLNYWFAKTDKQRTTNHFSSAWENKWFNSETKWDLFTKLQFDWSEFHSWDKRIFGTLGFDYVLYDVEDSEKSIKFTSKFGVGFKKEFQSENDDFVPEGLVGLSLDWKLPNDQYFKADTSWFPDFQDMGNYRVLSVATWNIKIDKENNLDFSIGLKHEYESVVDVGVKKTHLHLTSGISYSF